MNIVGIVAEYNPFHAGHRWHIAQTRRWLGECAVVAVMSGNFVQRGDCAIEDKWARTRSALEGGADLVLLVNTDRGLCGGLNANLIKMTREHAPENTHYITIGRKLNAALAKWNERLEATWSLTDPLSLLELKPVFDFIVQKFKAEEYGRVFVAFSGFVNTMVQKPIFRQLLPIEPEPLMKMAKAGGAALDGEDAHKQFLLEPSPAALLDTILPLYVFHGLVQIVLEARASEHSARMVAMKGATENAKNIIDGLTLDYNKARQTQITNELLEITTAMRAME